MRDAPLVDKADGLLLYEIGDVAYELGLSVSRVRDLVDGHLAPASRSVRNAKLISDC